MAKKKTNRRHDTFLQVRVESKMLKQLHDAAAADNRTFSNWVRDRLQKAANRELKK